MQPGSGSQPTAKGDFRAAGNVRGECKFTSKSEYRLEFKTLEKIRLEALKGSFEDWVLQLEFVGAVGQSEKLAILGWAAFHDLWDVYAGEYLGLHAVALCQVGRQFIFKLDEWRKRKGVAGKLTLAYRVAFIEPDRRESYLGEFAIIPWQVYLDLRQAMRGEG